MIKGMTGFGHAQITRGPIKAVVEIKSLNHRYLDIAFYLPVGFASTEQKIRQIIEKNVERGRVTVSLKIIEKHVTAISLNKEIAHAYMSKARQLQKELGLKNDLALSDILKLPGVVETKETLVTAEELWPVLEKGFSKALEGLVTMREQEGKSLKADITDKLKGMKIQLNTITARSKHILREKKKILTDDEFRSFQKGADINEEISRMMHYLEEIFSLFKNKIAAGKKIDFIAQEMQRETNTIGSKLQDRIVSNAVITLKSKVEKIREQAQNVE